VTNRAKIVKISKTGTVSVSYITGNYFIYQRDAYENNTPLLSKDGTKIFVQLAGDGKSQLYSISTADIGNGNIVPTLIIANSLSKFIKFAIYKDLYIWVASGNTVNIYDYTTKAELASIGVANYAIYAIVCDAENNLYINEESSGADRGLTKIEFDGVGTLTKTRIFNKYNAFPYTKQLLIDPFGDLIILTNSGTASTLLKYTTAGVQIGTAITLANPSYNLNVDIDGNYFYYTALAEYMVPANATAGQPIKPLNEHIPTRGTGIVGYGSNTTGYQPSVYAE
jgi:hypothetical protein